MPADLAHLARPTAISDATIDRTERLLLPSLHERLRLCLGFLALGFSLYILAFPFMDEPHKPIRLFLNVARLVALWTSVWMLRTECSRERALSVAGVALGVTMLTGGGISLLRETVFPFTMVCVAVSALTCALVPWGMVAQTVLTAASVATIGTCTYMLYSATSEFVSIDSAASAVSIFVLAPLIANHLDRTRRVLVQQIAEAGRSREELAQLHAHLEKRFAERTAELEMANRELEAFSYTVSHDLRSPLRAISGFSELLLEDEGLRFDEGAKRSLSRIHAASRRMDALIDDILLLARVGRGGLRYETVDLAAMARSIGEELAAEFRDHPVRLRVEPIPEVPGDHALLHIAMDNLLRNAWKFTGGRDDAEVIVSGEVVGTNVACRVRDNGIGFDPRYSNKLFKPFSRIHEEPRFGGAGIGLATVARVALRHGGEVEAEGALDQGATFSILLPAVR